MQLSYVLRNLNQFGDEARKLLVAAARVEISLAEEQRALAETIRRIYAGMVRGEAPVGKGSSTDAQGHRHPGFLRDTIKGEITRIGGGLVVGFSSGADYTRCVIDGTKAHVITPKRAKVLAWPGPGGAMVFAARVNHPGTKPNPFHVRAYQRSQPAINAALALLGHKIAVSFNP